MSIYSSDHSLRFNFSAAKPVRNILGGGKYICLDKEPTGLHMKSVDILIEEPDHWLLVEVKEPAAMPSKQKQTAKSNQIIQTLIQEKLVRQARDSYLWLHLRNLLDKPVDFVAVVDLDGLLPNPEMALGYYRKDLVNAVLSRQGQPWELKYLRFITMLTLGQWNSHYPRFPAKRI